MSETTSKVTAMLGNRSRSGHVYMGAYTKGPGKGEESVKKALKTGSVYKDTFFQKDVKAVVEDTEALESTEASDRFSTDSLKRALAVLGLDGQPSDRGLKKAYRLKALNCQILL